MTGSKPRLILIGGPNGAGKTTAAMRVLPDPLSCIEYLNADEIARGLSPLNPSSAAVSAGKILIQRAYHHLEYQLSFAVESTLASKMPLKLAKAAKAKGYEVLVLYFWLGSPELALERVAFRVSEGGHNVPEDDVVRRYWRSIRHFHSSYASVADYWSVYDNSAQDLQLMATYEPNFHNQVTIYQAIKWQRFTDFAEKPLKGD
jgi:predicted ABC-type ATPase